MNIQDIRKQYPQYNDLSDQELAAGFHRKFYSDLPFEDFASRVGLKAEAAPTAPVTPTPTERVAAVETPAAAPVSPEETAPPTPTAATESPITDFLGRVAKNIPESMNIGAAGAFRSLGEQASQVYQQTPAGRFYQALTGTIGQKDPAAAFADVMAESARASEARKEKAPPDQGLVLSGIESGLESLGQNLALLPAALMPGGQPAVLTAFGGITGGQAYQEAREKGLSPQQALPFAVSQGVIEVVTEQMPLGKLLDDINKKTGFGRMLLNQLKKEIPGEQLATVLQDLNEWAVLHPEKPFTDYLAERPSAAAQTLIATIVGTGGNVIVGKGMQKGAEKFAGLQTEEEKLIAGLDALAETESVKEPVETESVRNAFATGFEQMYSRKATDEELDQMVGAYEQRKLAEETTGPDVTGRVEPGFQAPGEEVTGERVTPPVTEAGATGVGVSGMPTELAGTRAAPQLTPLGQLFQPSDTVNAQQKRTNIHYNTLMTQPDNPVTQGLNALDAAIQKAQDATQQIKQQLDLPNAAELDQVSGTLAPYVTSQLSSIAPAIAQLSAFGSAGGSAMRLVSASKDVSSGAKRGSQARVDLALKQVQERVNELDPIIEAANKEIQDPKVQERIRLLADDVNIKKGVALRREEVAALPMEQRTAALKKIEDEVRAEVEAKRAAAAPTPTTPPAPTPFSTAVAPPEAAPTTPTAAPTAAPVAAPVQTAAPTPFALPEGINDAQFLDAATKLRAGKVMAVPLTQLRPLKQSGLVLADNSLSPEGEALLDQMQTPAAAAPQADTGRILGMITAAAGPSFDATMATVLKSRKAAFNRLRKLFSEGKINAQQFTQAVIKILDDIDNTKMLDVNTSQRLVRGADIVRQRILEAVRRNKISRETAEFALWLIDRNPQLARDLAIKINLPKNKRAQEVSNGEAGYYVSASRLIRAILRRDPDTGAYYSTDPELLVHEILHHAERMLPAPLRKLIRKEWEKQLLRAAKKADASNDQNLKEYMALLMEAYTLGSEAAEKAANQYITDGRVPKSYYALTNPSEFWAVNGSDILYGRYKADTNFAKVKQWFSELIEAIKRIFGLDNNAAVIKGLRAVMEGDGTFVSRYILAEGTAKAPMLTPFEEGEKKLLQQVEKGVGKLSQPVVDAINNNDISGALTALASRLTNPLYKELVQKLAALNLPTAIAFNQSRDLTRRQIDKESGPQQNRLFAYVQITYPELYDTYFKNYDREENLEQVYKGIKELKSSRYNMQPVIAEFTDVSKSFEDNIPGLEVAGAYYPAFDSITIDLARATNDTLLHEVLHAATEAILEAPLETLTEGQRAAREELQKIYDYAVANIPLDLYGLTNIHEFVSELFSNKAFQDRLKQIQYKPARVPILTKLVQTIFKMIGIDNLAGNAMVQATQLFSAVRTRAPAQAGARFAPKGKRVRGPVSTTWRTAEQVGVKLTDEIQKAIKGHGTWSEMLPRISKAMWGAGNTVFRKAILGVANLRQIDDLTKTKFPQISGAIRIIEQMIADRNRTMTKAKDILTNWTRLQARNPGQSRLMGRIMLEATIRGIDPDTAPAGALNKPMQDAWNGLKPEFKAVYRQVRDFYADSINTMISEMKNRALQLPKADRQRVIKEINAKFGPDKLVKPYFPLRRFGQYWFQVGKGNFKEFYEFESALGREMAFLKRKAQLEKGNAQQRDLAETMRKGNGISELYNQNASTTQVLKDAQELVDNVTSTNVADIKKELKESLDQLIYILLPQQSVRKMFINRQSIQGASEDMIRVFATTAVHTAYQQSRFKFAEKFVNNLLNAKEYIKELPNSDVYDDYIKEVEKRTPTILSNEDTSMAAVVAGKVSDATFYFMLSAPFSAMLNILGMAAITMPYIGGRYGYAKANAVMLKNIGRYTATLPKRSISPALKGQIMQMEFPSIVEGGKLDPLMQRAADRFIEDNDINISQTNDIMDIGGRPSELYTGRYNTVKRAIAALFHQSERLNREVTLLSTFELAYEKFLKEPKKDLRGVIQRDANDDPIPNTPDEAFELAITEAKDIAGLSLGDFTRQMKPRYFTPPLLSVLTKFKQYSVLATYVVARNFYFTFAAPFRKGEIDEFRRQMEQDGIPADVIEQRIAEADAQRRATYKEGRRRLAGILGMTFLLGGAEALPFFTLGIGTLIKMLANDDDDEFFDWENWFKNYMEVELGGYMADLYKKLGMKEETATKAGRKTMEAAARGPASVITGGSLTERVSLDPVNLWLRDPRFSTDTRESVVEGVIANAGPVVGLMVNWAEAIELVEQGQYQRAFEKAAPAIVSKPAAAYRIANEGAKTKSGITLVDNFSAWEIAMQSVGLQPERLAQRQKAAIEGKTYEQKVLDRRNTIMNRLWMERGNADAYGSVIENVQKFNQKYPEYAIEPKDVMDSFKRRGQSQLEAEVFGAQIQKNLRPRISPMLEYGRE